VISHRVRDILYYVDFDQVLSRVRNDSSKANQNLELKDFVQQIQLATILPNVEFVSTRSEFSKTYWNASCCVKRPDGKHLKVIVCKSRAILCDGLPETKLVLTNNQELYNMDWDYGSHLLKSKLLYLSLHRKRGKAGLDSMFDSICLATYRLDEDAKKFTKVYSEKFTVPRDLVALTLHRHSHSDLGINDTFNKLMVTNGRVFSVVQLESFKNCFWIHCFVRNKILPIAGAKTRVPGLYSIDPTIRLQYEYSHNGDVVGIFGVDLNHRTRSNDRVYNTWRYILV
jgi:hypothetical protein